jgi:hypothetical protein
MPQYFIVQMLRQRQLTQLLIIKRNISLLLTNLTRSGLRECGQESRKEVLSTGSPRLARLTSRLGLGVEHGSYLRMSTDRYTNIWTFLCCGRDEDDTCIYPPRLQCEIEQCERTSVELLAWSTCFPEPVYFGQLSQTSFLRRSVEGKWVEVLRQTCTSSINILPKLSKIDFGL